MAYTYFTSQNFTNMLCFHLICLKRQVGFDKQNRPVIYACFAQQATKKNHVEDTVAHTVNLMENVIKTMRGDASKMVWVLDCTGIKIFLGLQ